MTEQMNQQYQPPVPPGYMPPPPPQKKRWPYVLLGILGGIVIIIVAISVCFIVVIGKGVEKAEEVGLIGNETHEGVVGAPVKCGNNLELIVHSAEEVTSDNQYLAPGEGVYYLALDLSFENKGKESEPVSTIMEMTLRDSEGREFSPYITTIKEPWLPEGDIAPGSKIRGYVTFKVTEGAKGLAFKFSPLLGDSAIVALQ